MKNIWFRLNKEDEGQVMVEFALAFPLVLFVSMSIIQIALIYVARMQVHAATFSACRAVVAEIGGPFNEAQNNARAKDAAAILLAPLSVADSNAGNDTLNIPGWGAIKGWGNARNLITIEEIQNYSANSSRGRDITLVLSYEYPLVIPGVNFLFYEETQGNTGYKSGQDATQWLAFDSAADRPTIKLMERVSLVRPWHAVDAAY